MTEQFPPPTPPSGQPWSHQPPPQPQGPPPQGPPPQGPPPQGPPPGTPPRAPGRPPLQSPPPGADFPGRTLGIVGLVLAFVANIVGIIVSAIALSQSRAAGLRNTPALIGVIAGSALLALGLVIGLVAAAVGITTGLTAAGIAAGSGLGTSQGPGDPDTGPGTDGSVPEGTSTDVFDLQIGDCFQEVDGGDDPLFEVDVVDCAEPHYYEVYDETTLPDTADSAYPGDDKMQVAADAACYDGFADFVGIDYEESFLDYWYLSPTETSWESGDRSVLCSVFDPEYLTTGTLKGAAE